MCVFIFHFFCVLFYDIGLHFHNNNNNNNNQLTELIWYRSISKRRKRHICKISHSSEFFSMDVTSWEVRSRGARRTQNKARFPSKRNARNARNATQSIALRKRKPQATQAFDWLLRWLAVSIDHSYWLALACVAFEWKPVLRNVFCLRNFIAFIAFLVHFLTQSIALRALRLDGNRA